MSLTIRQALFGTRDLQQSCDSWRLDGELLLAAALQQSREYLHTWPERELSVEVLELFQSLLARRRQGEPVAYILGTKDFWDFQLRVTADVLIPRPETELLVETALQLLSEPVIAKPVIADLGTGSGAIALALARELPGSHITAIDISSQALSLARSNANALGVDNIEFALGNWCDTLETCRYDLIAANPPYVAADDEHLRLGDLRYEPTLALVAGEAGLSAIHTIVRDSGRALKKDAWLLVEHGHGQGAAVQAVLTEQGFRGIESGKDLAGLDRLSFGQWPG